MKNADVSWQNAARTPNLSNTMRGADLVEEVVGQRQLGPRG
jgi:hypothetical protein